MHPSASSLQFPVVYKDTERTPQFQESEKSLRSLASVFDMETNEDLTQNVCEPMEEDSSDVEIENCSVDLCSVQGENGVSVSTAESHSASTINSLSDTDSDQNKTITNIINISSAVSTSNDSEVIELEESTNSNSDIEEVPQMSCNTDKPSNINLSSTSPVIIKGLNLREDSSEIRSPRSGECKEIKVEEPLNRSAENHNIPDLKSSEDVSAIELNTTIVSDVNIEQQSSDQVIQAPLSKEDNKLETTDSNGKQNIETRENIQTDLKDGTKDKIVEIGEVNNSKTNESNCKMSPNKEHTKSLPSLERKENIQEECSESEMNERLECDMINESTSNEKLPDDESISDEPVKMKGKAVIETEIHEINNKKKDKLPHDEYNDLKTSNGEPVKKKVKVATEAEEPVINSQESGKLLDDEYNDLLSSFKDKVIDQ